MLLHQITDSQDKGTVLHRVQLGDPPGEVGVAGEGEGGASQRSLNPVFPAPVPSDLCPQLLCLEPFFPPSAWLTFLSQTSQLPCSLAVTF